MRDKYHTADVPRAHWAIIAVKRHILEVVVVVEVLCYGTPYGRGTCSVQMRWRGLVWAIGFADVVKATAYLLVCHTRRTCAGLVVGIGAD